jgi:hypothetical protein
MVSRVLYAFVLACLLISACATTLITPTNPAIPKPTPPPAALHAKQTLAAALGVSPAAIEVVSAGREEWSDACLGLADPEEMCAQVITLGWLVLLEADGTQYTARTDQTGENVRFE